MQHLDADLVEGLLDVEVEDREGDALEVSRVDTVTEDREIVLSRAPATETIVDTLEELMGVKCGLETVGQDFGVELAGALEESDGPGAIKIAGPVGGLGEQDRRAMAIGLGKKLLGELEIVDGKEDLKVGWR